MNFVDLFWKFHYKIKWEIRVETNLKCLFFFVPKDIFILEMKAILKAKKTKNAIKESVANVMSSFSSSHWQIESIDWC